MKIISFWFDEADHMQISVDLDVIGLLRKKWAWPGCDQYVRGFQFSCEKVDIDSFSASFTPALSHLFMCLSLLVRVSAATGMSMLLMPVIDRRPTLS